MTRDRGKRWQYADAVMAIEYLVDDASVAVHWMEIKRECWDNRSAREMIMLGRGAEVAQLVDEEFDACQNGTTGPVLPLAGARPEGAQGKGDQRKNGA